ncbi:MAG: hypothetical protein V4463_05175 [Pseudomonadota bacterium]
MADAFLAALLTFRTQLVALGSNVYSNAVDCYNNAVAAAQSASDASGYSTSASGSATAAAASAGAPAWVSGTTYAQYAAVMSKVDYRIYRRITASGSGTTDPSADTTNYTLVLAGAFPFMHVREQQASGTTGGSSAAGFQTRVLNTTVGSNTISGASLASNMVTLPAGTYDFEARAPAGYNIVTSHQLVLRNNTDSTDILVGETAYPAATGPNVYAECGGRFTLAATKVVYLNHYTNASGSDGLGKAASSGKGEVYSSLKIWRVS